MSTNDGNVKGDQERTKKVGAIRRGIRLFEKQMRAGNMKVTASEYIRLLELLQQVDEDEPKEIRVRWVERDETESSTN